MGADQEFKLRQHRFFLFRRLYCKWSIGAHAIPSFSAGFSCSSSYRRYSSSRSCSGVLYSSERAYCCRSVECRPPVATVWPFCAGNILVKCLQQRTPQRAGVRSPSARTMIPEESAPGGTYSRGAWTLAFVLSAVDVVCYFLHQHEVRKPPCTASGEAWMLAWCSRRGSKSLTLDWLLFPEGSRSMQCRPSPIFHFWAGPTPDGSVRARKKNRCSCTWCVSAKVRGEKCRKQRGGQAPCLLPL